MLSPMPPGARPYLALKASRFSFQASSDLFTISCAASSGVSAAITVSATVSLDTASHTPSDAITMNLSFSAIWMRVTSGSQVTPMLLPTASPSDRVTISPGLSASCSQMRRCPLTFWLGRFATRAPAAMTRLSSSSFVRRWSGPTTVVVVAPVALRDSSSEDESPTAASHAMPFFTRHVEQVLPLRKALHSSCTSSSIAWKVMCSTRSSASRKMRLSACRRRRRSPLPPVPRAATRCEPGP
mmetsp:Transcript_33093/g.84533  ORF Transcript_33093/g.84533 Transcript_33093/m.84533 type:complete len:241 (-) Transcript_33093:554-1276(-)